MNLVHQLASELLSHGHTIPLDVARDLIEVMTSKTSRTTSMAFQSLIPQRSIISSTSIRITKQ